MLPLAVWSHSTEYADVEEVDIMQPAAAKETYVIQPAVAENVDSDLMVNSRKPRLPMQE